MFSRRLNALGYPGWRAFNPEDDGQASVLLSWLEDTKIRLWKIEERRSIRVVSSSEHKAPFPNEAQRRYLSSVGCPQSHMRSKVRIASWLISHAISLEYRDLIDDQDEDLKEVIQNEEDDVRDEHLHKGDSASEPDDFTLPSEGSTALQEDAKLIASSNDFKSVEWKRRVQKLALTLGAKFPESVAGQVQVIRAIANLICRRFRCGLCEGKRAPEENVERLFSELYETEVDGEGDVNTEKIWCALRLLSVAELEVLQGEINDLLGVVQTFTADPKVNPSLGVVGK